MVYSMGMLTDDPVRKGYVCCDDKITCLCPLYDQMVCLVCTLINEEILNMGGFANGDLLIGYDCGGEGESLYGSQHDGFEQIREGIPIDKKPQERISLTLPTSLVSSRTLIPCG